MAEIVEKPKSFSATAKDIAQRFFRHENAVLIIVLIALIAAMSVVTKGLTSTRTNLMNILLQSSTRGIAAIGQTFVILSAGIDLSVGGAGLFCSILGASLMTEDLGQNIVGYPIPLASGILIMLLAGAGWGTINGLSVSRIGMPALIVTLAMWQITTGSAFLFCRGYTFSHLPQAFYVLGGGKIAAVPAPVIIFIAVAVIAYFVLNHTTFGRSVYAVGGNPVSAWLSGINVKNTLLSVYVISGFLAAIAGIVMSSRMMSAGMSTVVGLELDSIAASVIGGVSLMGGKGTVIGSVIGVMILGIINNAMNVLAVNAAYQKIIKGAIIVSAVAIDYTRKP